MSFQAFEFFSESPYFLPTPLLFSVCSAPFFLKMSKKDGENKGRMRMKRGWKPGEDKSKWEGTIMREGKARR